MTAPPVECRYYGRDFTTAEMALLRALIAGPPARNRHALSKEFCRRIGWYKADGGIKDMMARVVMLAMHRDDECHVNVLVHAPDVVRLLVDEGVEAEAARGFDDRQRLEEEFVAITGVRRQPEGARG